MSVRFLHTADLHLGSPLRTIGAESKAVQESLADATFNAFASTIDLAIEECVDFVVIAGDIYDKESRSVRANQFVVDQLGRLGEHDIPCYLSYGNHDPLGSGAELLDLPDNVHAFGSDDAEIVEYRPNGTLEARVIGQSYRSSSDSRAMYENYEPPDGDVPNLAVLHSGLDPDAGKYVPCSAGDLRNQDEIHYWALGHIHQQRIYEGEPPLAYPGIPQSRQVTEPAVGGCLLVEVDTTGTPEMTFAPTSPIIWQTIQFDVESVDEELENVSDIQAGLNREARSIQEADRDRFLPDLGIGNMGADWSPEGFICRWELTGRGEVHQALETEDEVETFLTSQLRHEFEGEAPFVWTESVRNRVGPPLPDPEELRDSDPVLGEFLDVVEEVEHDEGLRRDLRKEAGDIWFEPEDPEDVRDDELPLTEEKLDELLDRAESRVIRELIERREYVDT